MPATPGLIPAGRTVIWRYNVDGAWALVSDPAQAIGNLEASSLS
jgi:hypothetical protein